MNKRPLKKLDQYTLKRCKLFADFSAETSSDEYAKRNQNNIEKIKLDIYRGKAAEFMVYNYLVNRGNKVNLPDLEIYSKNQKSFDADLICGKHNIHVKSCVVNNKFPVSWMFQKKDHLTSGRSKDYVCLVVMNESFSGGFYIYQANQLDFKPPVKKALQASKVTVYETDLA